MTLDGSDIVFGMKKVLPACAGLTSGSTSLCGLVLRPCKLVTTLFVEEDCLKESFWSVKLFTVLLKQPINGNPVSRIWFDLT